MLYKNKTKWLVFIWSQQLCHVPRPQEGREATPLCHLRAVQTSPCRSVFQETTNKISQQFPDAYTKIRGGSLIYRFLLTGNLPRVTSRQIWLYLWRRQPRRDGECASLGDDDGWMGATERQLKAGDAHRYD